MTQVKRLSGKERRALRARAVLLDPVVRIGKKGLTSGVIQEVDRQLEERGLIKVRFERNILRRYDRKELAEELARKVNAELIDVRGRTAVLFRPREGWRRFHGLSR
ncbi:ribosome assembly RNA-binding protein YhbY [Methanopyrus kandleri]|uniref:Predicted RNA-binding protein containing KH domain, possibly ribosomal protein n=2 Tax=Methanopyrus kandleri TaxID=2320 RepID=Q8TUY0_METKA|nr:ribosome assembly RNA-binding protein YhbY [Methanopyrus kandleri]AAM02834.1 Predicted RNA-binding protein containing KH domain, possibly ribosomal protein [Methanopyrus kandleri AV19]HII71094.1 ribosome assembly RNA-binding protein YhbY [Methanopyrus kandleri]